MAHYFIEFRFQGRAKKEMKKLIWEVDKRFKLGHARKHRPVPHITIVPPFKKRDERKLIDDFKEICRKYSMIKFKIEGYGCFPNTKVVYINIKPSREMLNFRKNLLKMLKLRYPSYSPHASIALKLSPNKFERVKEYINKKRKLSKNYVMARATLIKGRRILCEYDFTLKKLLGRKEAKSKAIYSKTVKRIKREDKCLFSILKRLFGK